MNSTVKNLLRENARQYGMVVAFIAIIVFFFLLTEGKLLRPLNVTNIVLQNSYILILAIGMLPVILIGKFDLSVGSVAAFVGGVAAIMQVNYGMSFVPVLIISLLLGALIGVWQGFWIAYVKIPAFVLTLSTMLIFRGFTIAVLDGRSIGPMSPTLRAMSSSFLPDFLGGAGRLHLATLVIGVIACLYVGYNTFSQRREKLKYDFEVWPLWMELAKLLVVCGGILLLTYFFAAFRGLPTVMIIICVLAVVYSFITERTVPGRRLYALGGNEHAAELTGIRTKYLTFICFINLGVLSALAGLVFTARLNAGTPKAGNGFELDAISSCFIGGASSSGGIGTVAGAIIGALIMGVMNNGMSLMGISIDYQQAIKGMVLLMAVAFDLYTKSRK